MVDHIIILAGGAGTRLWPASLKKIPKQFLPVAKGRSLLQLTLQRAFSLDPSGKVIIVTLKEQLSGMIDECAKLPEIDDYRDRLLMLPEPCARNTAPAIAIAATYLRQAGQDLETMLVLPADHLITPFEDFRRDVEKADLLGRRGFLVTFGIKPDRPETGYGYIERGEQESPGWKVNSFREKPDRKTAEEFLAKKTYSWNSGMFCFQVGRYLEELNLHRPDIGKLFLNPGPVSIDPRKTPGGGVILEDERIETLYASSPADSIDYAVMEKCDRAAVVESGFNWNDVGSWDELSEIQEQSSEIFQVGGNGNFVSSDLPVALCGVRDLIVVVRNGKVLVCKKGSGQLVKQAVELMKEAGRGDLL